MTPGPARTAHIRQRLATGATLREVGAECGVSHERIRQIAVAEGIPFGYALRVQYREFVCPGCGVTVTVREASLLQHCSRECRTAARRRRWRPRMKMVCEMRAAGVSWAEIGAEMGYGAVGRRAIMSQAARYARELGVEIPLGPSYAARPGRRV